MQNLLRGVVDARVRLYHKISRRGGYNVDAEGQVPLPFLPSGKQALGKKTIFLTINVCGYFYDVIKTVIEITCSFWIEI